MASKIITVSIFVTLAISCCTGGVITAVPAAIPAAYSIPYASSYTANVVNHAVATPLAAAPLVAAPAPWAVAAPAAPLAYRAFLGK